MLEELKEKYRQFKAWQQQPYQVKPLSEEAHVCTTCGTRFEGNYCPRCGQSATIGRYSFKTAILLFLDVWGLGNRGMFRSIRDLVLRPGYMIRDYLSGMQMAYFPPFKMFFLLIALSVLIDSGLNIQGVNTIKQNKEKIEDLDNGIKKGLAEAKEKSDSVARLENQEAVNTTPEVKHDDDKDHKKVVVIGQLSNVYTFLKKVVNWIMDNQAIFYLLWLLSFSAPLYLFFHRNPNIPDIRYSEFFVAMVYTSNMMNIFTIIGSFFSPYNTNIAFFALFLSIIPLKQLLGFSYWRTFYKICKAFILLMTVSIIVTIGIGFLVVTLVSQGC